MKKYKKVKRLSWEGKFYIILFIVLLVIITLSLVIIKEDKDTKKRIESTCTSSQVLTSYYSNDGEKHYYCK